MIDRVRLSVRMSLPIFITIAAMASTAQPDEPKNADAEVGQYYAKADLFSFRPGAETTTYKSYGIGAVGPNGTYFSYVTEGKRMFEVRITGQLKAHRFNAHVMITPGQRDAETKSQNLDFDLTDLTPKSLEIAKDGDGRVYRLNFAPQIREFSKVIPFRITDLHIDSFSFPNSPVIANDTEYLGEMSCSSGSLAFCDIPGLAKIEFSLLHLKDSSPLGSLKNGVINIADGSGDSVRITNVKNGVNGEVLAGGPYQIWVRWKKPTQTMEEFRETLKKQIAEIKERVKNDELSLPPGSFERLEKMSESGRAGLLSFGVSQVEPNDLADAKK